MNEIEDSVRGGQNTGNERGPCDRTLRRRGGLQSHEGALVPQTAQMGKIIPVSFDERRVHPIDPDNNHPIRMRRVASPAGRQEQERNGDRGACSDLSHGGKKNVMSLRRSAQVSKASQLFDGLLIEC